MRFRSALAVGFWLVWCMGVQAQTPTAGEALLADPSIRHGSLPNGLRYAIMPNATPKGALSLRLTFDVGSLEEAEDERGAAHFVEHMAFRDTRHFPEGELEAALAPLGVGFGRDQNAFTSTESTVYVLDLPSAGERHREVAFKWLRDVAYGVRFESGPVNRERGVVLAERGATRDPGSLTQDAITAFQAPELLTTRRPPIGELDVLRAMGPEALQAFYRRWYRPEHALLTVVGDVTGLADLEAEIARSFGDWRGAGPPPPRAVLSGPDMKRGLDAFGLSAPHSAPGILVCRIRPTARVKLDNLAAFKAQTRRNVALRIMNSRLSRLAISGRAVDAAEAMIEQEREATRTCVLVGVEPERWAAGLATIQSELRRLSEEDVGEDELDEAIAELRGEWLGYVTRSATMDSSALATYVAEEELAGATIMAPNQFLRAFNRSVEGLTPAEIKATWRSDWSGAGPFVAVVAPQPPTREAILAAWAQNAAAEAVPASAPKAKASAYPQWAYVSPGAPGKVVAREAHSDPDFVRLRFANGLMLNFKQTSFDRGMVEVRVHFGAGREELGERSVAEGQLAADFFIAGGLGRHSYADLQAIEGSEAMSIELSMQNHAFVLQSTSFVSRLSQQLRIMAAYLSDPGFREDADSRIQSVVANAYRRRPASPHAMLIDGMEAAMVPPRTPPPEEEMARLGASDFAAFLRPAVTSAPLEVTLVGDLSEAAAAEAVAATLGALPAREPRAAGPAYRGFQHFPATMPPPIRRTHTGPAHKAAVAVVWPGFVATPERMREEYVLELLAYVFDDVLRHEVRERLGQAYSPAVGFYVGDRADQTYVKAEVETSPADLPTVEAQIRSLAARLADGGVTAQMLEAARKPRLAAAQSDLTDNVGLAWGLHYAGRDLRRVRELDQAPRILADLTLAEVQAAATQWLGAQPMIVIATPETGK